MSPRTLHRLGRFVLAAVLLPAFTLLASGGPTPSNSGEQPKIEEIEKAGEALMKGKADEAYKLLQEAVKKNPTLPPARLMLARLYLSPQNPEQAQRMGRGILEVAVADTPDHPEVYLTNAEIALRDGRLTDTILNCRTALSLSDQSRWTADQKKKFTTEARSLLATAFENRRDWGSARTEYAGLLEMQPKNGQLRAKLATALFFLDKPEDARAELITAVRDDPTLNPPDVTVGRLWMTKADYAKATEAMERAVKSEGNNFRVHLAYADLLLQENKIDAAKIHAEIAAKQDAKNTDVQKTLGLIARCQKDLAAAQRIFEDLLRANPADFFASDQLALVLVDQSDEASRNRGRQLAEVNARQYPRSPEAAGTLGYAYYRLRNLTDAANALNASLQLTSGSIQKPDTAYYLALVFNEQEKFEEAKKILDGALKLNGLFVYKKEAQDLLDKVKKKVPDKATTSDKGKAADKGKGGS